MASCVFTRDECGICVHDATIASSVDLSIVCMELVLGASDDPVDGDITWSKAFACMRSSSKVTGTRHMADWSKALACWVDAIGCVTMGVAWWSREVAGISMVTG